MYYSFLFLMNKMFIVKFFCSTYELNKKRKDSTINTKIKSLCYTTGLYKKQYKNENFIYKSFTILIYRRILYTIFKTLHTQVLYCLDIKMKILHYSAGLYILILWLTRSYEWCKCFYKYMLILSYDHNIITYMGGIKITYLVIKRTLPRYMNRIFHLYTIYYI